MQKEVVTIDQEYLVFYKEIGVVITTWAMIEIGLSSIVSACLPTSKSSTLTAGFFAIENFRSKLKFVDEVVIEEVSDTSKKLVWDKLHKKVLSLSTLRNKLVHRLTTTVPDMPAGKRVVLLHPNFYRTLPAEFVNSKGRPKLPADSITIADICEMRFKLRPLSVALFGFAAHLQGGPAPPLAPLERSVSRQKIADLVNHTRSTLGLPLRPSSRSRKKKA